MATPRHNLNELLTNQSSPELVYNAAMGTLDALVQISVVNANLTDTPGSPVDGDLYIIGGAPSSGQWQTDGASANQIAQYYNTEWLYHTPLEGYQAYDKNTNKYLKYDGSSWSSFYSELVGAPASASATGSPGQISYDTNYFYICTATDTWKRVAITTW